MSKKIALVGNMNNNFFAIARYLRDAGYDAHLFYRLGMDHFQPKADTYNMDYMEYCHEVNWLKSDIFYSIDVEAVKSDLAGYDIVIGQGDEAAIAAFCDIKTHIYYPYGSDVYKYAQQPEEFTLANKIAARLGRSRVPYKLMRKGTHGKFLKKAIVEADHILAEYTNEDFEKKLSALAYKGKYEHIPMPMIYHKVYDRISTGSKADVHWKSVMDDLRMENDFLLLYHGRQEWKTYWNDFTVKNTHHLIQGFAGFIKKNSSAKAKLVMLEYGWDVGNSKQLIKSLGIEDRVVWFPKMYRKDLMYLIHTMDICSGEFGMSYLTFGTIMEAMLMKKPVIHYRNDELYNGLYDELYPLFNAREPEEIENCIIKAYENKEETKEMGQKAFEWAHKNFIKNPVNHLLNIIQQY